MADSVLVSACNVSTLAKNSSRGFEVNVGKGTLFGFVVRDGAGVLAAYKNSCPHTGAPLNWTPDKFLSLAGEYIQCSIHGARFLLNDGRCITGPCVGKELVPLQVFEKNGELLIDVESL